MKVTPEELKRRINLSMSDKIQWAIERYIDFVEVFGLDSVYKCFSGGKDSTVVEAIINKLHDGEMEQYLRLEYIYLYNLLIKGKQAPPSAFCDTGLEFPEIRKYVKEFNNVIWLKPAMKFPEVIKTIGFAVGSKKIARMLSDFAKPTPNNEASRNLYLTGIRRDGEKSRHFQMPAFWKKFIGSDIKVSGKCCDVFKKDPFKKYQKKTGRKPITGTTTSESAMRKMGYMQTGCNSFEKGKEMCRMISIFTEEDIWAFAEQFNIRFAEVYYNRNVVVNGKSIFVKAEKRTGCMFCLFGIHLEKKGMNRFQKMSITHPRQYKYCIEELGIGKVLEFIGVKYTIEKKYEQKEITFL